MNVLSKTFSIIKELFLTIIGTRSIKKIKETDSIVEYRFFLEENEFRVFFSKIEEDCFHMSYTLYKNNSYEYEFTPEEIWLFFNILINICSRLYDTNKLTQLRFTTHKDSSEAVLFARLGKFMGFNCTGVIVEDRATLCAYKTQVELDKFYDSIKLINTNKYVMYE